MPEQRTLAEVRRARPETIVGWLRAGELEALLAGRDPGPAEPEPSRDGADQGARHDPFSPPQLSRGDLQSMTPAEIALALHEGRLAELLRGQQ